MGVRLEELEQEIEKLNEKAFTLEEKDTSPRFDAEGREGDAHVRHADFEEGNPFAKAEQALRENPPSPEKLRESDARIDEVVRGMVDWEEDTGEGRAERGFG